MHMAVVKRRLSFDKMYVFPVSNRNCRSRYNPNLMVMVKEVCIRLDDMYVTVAFRDHFASHSCEPMIMSLIPRLS